MQYKNRIIGEGMEAPENLLANPSNWRTHPQHQKDALRGVLSEVGFVQRVIVNQRSGFVVDGHARVAVAMQENQAEIPVLYVDLTDEEEALILATLDPLGALAGKDDEQLAELLDRVSAEDPAVQALLDDLLDSIAKAEEIPPGPDPSANVVPEVKETPISRPGDIWVLGDHRVLCGDSTSFGDVEKLIGSEVVDLVHADPPYGMGKQADGVANDNIYREKLDAFQLEMQRVMLSSLKKGGLCYEPFGGSGSTLIGAEKTGRRCYTIELQPQYVDVIVRRWESFTGKHAVLENDGRTFGEIAAETENA